MDFRIIIKVLVTAVVVVAVSEVGKRSSMVAAILVSLPLTSLLAFMWMNVDKASNESVADLSMSIFWLVIPSLAFFPVFAVLLRNNMQFWLAMLIAAAVTVAAYYGFVALMERLNIKL